MRENRSENRTYQYMEDGVYGPVAGEDRRVKKSDSKVKRIPSLEKMMAVLGSMMVICLMFVLFGDFAKELPESVSVVGWTVVSFVVAGFASVGM